MRLRWSLITLAAAVQCLPAMAEKIRYEPLSNEAKILGRLDKYEHVETKQVTVDLGGAKLVAVVPLTCDAYDAVPIRYRLSGIPDGSDRVAVEAVAFEGPQRRKGRDLYDLALPGDMKLEIEYLGSRTGVFDPSRVSRLTVDSRHESFPPYALEPFVRSGTVKRGNYTWFKFRITNAGNTILDPEGFGGWMAQPDAMALDDSGNTTKQYRTVNIYERHTEYLYPGESFEQWVNFYGEGQPIQTVRTLPAGTFELRYVARYRHNTNYNWIVNMWGGQAWAGLKVFVTMADHAAETSVRTEPIEFEPPATDRMTRYVGSLEEFMTSFHVHERDALNEPADKLIYVQVAPWTQQIVLKLIGNQPGRIRTVAVPVKVSSDSMTIQPRPDYPFVVEKNGLAEPVICTQVMPAMRTTTQIGPEPEKHLRERYRQALDAGVNVLATTAGNWHIAQVYDPNAFVGDIHAETFKHFYDVIVPELGLPVFGWGLFPSKTLNVKGLGEMMLGRKTNISFVEAEGTTYAHGKELDVADRDYARLYATCILFNYRRWGDLWYKAANGDVLIDVEDTWGWLRDDINLRYNLGPLAVRGFQRWAREKYGDIEAVNAAWGTGYERFDEIDPQTEHNDGGTVEGVRLAHIKPEYTNPDNPFHDWSPAVADWDRYRTELRCDVYDAIQRHVRRDIPNAYVNLRTEGAVIPVEVPKDMGNSHIRHIYHVQRRNALIGDVLAERKTFKYHSDYTTIPYTEREWRALLRKLSDQGMVGNYLPQFCTARDMLVNDHYGRDFTIHYDLPEKKKAVMMHVLQAAYPVWRIMYEEGHIIGVLWEDYNCDGFVSETQMREMKLLRERLNAIARRVSEE